ncbi:MAG: hypothetical protein V3W52_12375 [Syntrophobacteria bacterium]
MLSRDHKDGCATWQLVPRYRGIGSEAYLSGTSQGPTPEDARKDDHIRGRSKQFMKYPGEGGRSLYGQAAAGRGISKLLEN